VTPFFKNPSMTSSFPSSFDFPGPLGRPNPIDVPPGVKAYVGHQLGITDTSSLPRYIEREATRLEHTAEIRSVYAYQDFHASAWRFRLSRMLYARMWISNERPGQLFDLATLWLIQRRVLLPGVSTLTRLIAQIRDRALLRAWQRLARLPNEEQRRQLEALLKVPEGKRRSRFDQLRQSPTRVSSTSMIAALERYKELRNLGIRALDFPRIPPVWLKSLTYELARPPEENHEEEMLTRYQTVRRFLPRVLETVSLKAAPAGSSVLTAVDYLKGLRGRRKPQLDDAPLNVVDAGWKRLVIDKKGQVSQPAYTLCVMERLQDRLRRRDIYVEESERWSDPRAKLLQGAEWEAKRTNICRTLGHSTSADEVVEGLGAELDATYRCVSDRFSKSEAVRVEQKDAERRQIDADHYKHRQTGRTDQPHPVAGTDGSPVTSRGPG
jgi:hypothetical protein